MSCILIAGARAGKSSFAQGWLPKAAAKSSVATAEARDEDIVCASRSTRSPAVELEDTGVAI